MSDLSSSNTNRESVSGVNADTNLQGQSQTKVVDVTEMANFFEKELEQFRAWIKPEKVNNMHKLINRTYMI